MILYCSVTRNTQYDLPTDSRKIFSLLKLVNNKRVKVENNGVPNRDIPFLAFKCLK